MGTSKHTPSPYTTSLGGLSIRAFAGREGYRGEGHEIARLTCFGGEEEAASTGRLFAASGDYYDAAEAIRVHVVGAERAEHPHPCDIPESLIRALLNAHLKAYEPPTH